MKRKQQETPDIARVAALVDGGRRDDPGFTLAELAQERKVPTGTMCRWVAKAVAAGRLVAGRSTRRNSGGRVMQVVVYREAGEGDSTREPA